MQVLEPKTVLGLYSDLSAVYTDACILKTDGLDIFESPISLTRPYSSEIREAILSVNYPNDFTDTSKLHDLNQKITEAHIAVIQELREKISRQLPHIDFIGYSGHLLHHDWSGKNAVVLGNSDVMAHQLHIPVIDGFIQTDLQAGGTGGPILTTFLETITRSYAKPLAIISLGGVTGITYIGSLGEQYAFEVGVGCLLLDRWLQRHAGVEMDFDGTWGAKGTIQKRLLDYLLKTPYLMRQPPKALDRDDFNHLLDQVEGCSPADGAATLTQFVVDSIVQALQFLPDKPTQFILTGGGTLNPTLVLGLKRALSGTVQTVKELKMPQYNLDAAGYAFLAARSVMNLPITFPGTTGVSTPMTGGIYHAID